MRYFTNKKLHMKHGNCYVIRCPVIYAVWFERCSLTSWQIQAWITQPWATSDFSSVVVDNYREPDTSRFQQAPGSAFLPQGFLHSPGNPSEFRGLMLLGAGISWAVFQFSEGQFSGSFCIVQLGLTTVKTASYCISSFPVSLSAPPYCCFLPNNLSALTSLFRSASRKMLAKCGQVHPEGFSSIKELLERYWAFVLWTLNYSY